LPSRVILQVEMTKKADPVEKTLGGGYFIPKVMAGVVNGRMFETTPMLQLANVMNVASKSVNMILDDQE
jgi:HK97 family phage major capsid protein